MINGKFFTGLPPKMINRSNSNMTNRLESHFFWPDDTNAESALETRVRRRASMSVAGTERPLVQKRHATPETSNEVDTRQMMRKEFTKSSIQFFDNIREEEVPTVQQRRKPLLKSTKQEITCKPTAIKMQLPEATDVETDTAAFKKKHVYDSKVQFYDFIDGGELNNRNNVRPPNMNDKKDMERNSKNSPKLQVKRNVHNYIRDEYQPDDIYKSRETRSTQDEPGRFRAVSEFRTTTAQKNEHWEDDRPNSRQSRAKSMEPSRHNKIYRRDQTPKRILKNYARNNKDYDDFDEYQNDNIDYVEQKMRQMVVNGQRSAPRKQVSYREDEEEIPRDSRDYQQRYNSEDDLYYGRETNLSKYGHANARYKANSAGSSRRQHYERSHTPDLVHSDFDHNQYMETENRADKQMTLNNYNNNTNTNTNNKNNRFTNNNIDRNVKLNNTMRDSLEDISPKMLQRDDTKGKNAVADVAQKHLRSSLCFSGGEIVAGDSATLHNTTSTAAASSAHRRNARSSATQRVSVGLPD